MSVKLRLKRMGRSNRSFFRLNAIDSRSPRDGRVIEELGHYDPRDKDQAKQFVAKLDRCRYWLDHGAVPSETVSSLLKKSGIEHKSLKLPKPGKPKAVPAAAEAAKTEAAPAAATPAAETAVAEAPAAETPAT
jgi:small subunit ribosomal protein S16